MADCACASRKLMQIALALSGFCAMLLVNCTANAQNEPAATVTVLTVTKSCFTDTVPATGILIPRNETSVRPAQPGLRVTDVLVEPGNTVTANQPLARLTTTDGGTATASTVTAPSAGLISASTAVVGTIASGNGDALFKILPRNEFDLMAQTPARDMPRLAAKQAAKVFVVGAGEIAGTVSRVGPMIEPNTQLGQVVIALSGERRLMINGYARATITVGESCGLTLPITSILYSEAGTVVQVVKNNRVETHKVEIGLMQTDKIEVRQGLAEGDVVVARAGATLREGDAVRPVPLKTP